MNQVDSAAPRQAPSVLDPESAPVARRRMLGAGLRGAALLGGAMGAAAMTSNQAHAQSSVVDYSQPGTFTAPQTFASSSSTDVPITVQGSSGQTQPLQEWRNSAGTVLTHVDPQGRLVFGGDTAIARTAPKHLTLDGSTFVNGFLTLRRDTDPLLTPELHFKSIYAHWLMGIDSSNDGGGRDYVLLARRNADGTTGDLIYVSHRAPNHPTVGIGVTPPDSRFRLQVSPPDSEPAMGGLSIRVPPNGTGRPLAIRDSGGTDRFFIDSGLWMNGLKARGDAVDNRIMTLAPSDLSNQYAFTSGGSDLRLRNLTAGKNVFSVGTDARMLFYTVANFSHSGAQLPHVGTGKPSGGLSGEIRVGNDKLWFNDQGAWKSVPVS